MIKVTREQANAIANLAEDLNGAQQMLEDGLGREAKAYIESSVQLLRQRLPEVAVALEYGLGKCFCTVTLGEHEYKLKSTSRERL